MLAHPATASRSGSIATKATIALVLVAVATLTLLGFGGAAHAATIRPVAPTHQTCSASPSPGVEGLEVVGAAAPTGSPELGAALGARQVHTMRGASLTPVGPQGYYAAIAAFWTKAVNADPASC